MMRVKRISYSKKNNENKSNDDVVKLNTKNKNTIT